MRGGGGGGGFIREVQERVSERIENVPGLYADGTLNISRVAEIGKQRAIGNSVVVCVCLCVRGCVRVCVCVRDTSLYRPKERPEVSFAFEFDPWTSFYNVFYIFI